MERRTSQSGQFHHYLPRFIVRGWLQEVKTVTTSPGRKTEGGRNRGRKRRESRWELINTYDIQADTLHMGTTDLGKTFGIVDLYRDNTDQADVYRVERAFARLENDTAQIFQILNAAERAGRPRVELVRSQLNTIRKFLFLVQYRHVQHAAQFIEGRFDPSTAAMVDQYRVQHGLADARAVWLHNLALLLEIEHWEVPTDGRLLWTTRNDYRMQAWNMQLGLYRAPPGTEFVLTENGLGLAEGARTPMSSVVELMSPGAPGPSFLPLTQSYPISPKLVIILRSTLLSSEAALIRQGVAAEEARRRTQFGLSNASYFHDIPRTSPQTTYIPVLPPDSYNWLKHPDLMDAADWQKEEDFRERGLLNGVPLGSRVRDRFVFAIDSLTEGQAQRVNTLLLTHCRETISFLTPTCLLQAINAFEKDVPLSIFGKSRYGSLKAKLTRKAERESASASPSASATVRPEASRPTSYGTFGSESTSEVAPVKTSLPGLKGAFSRKPRSVSTPNNSDAILLERASLLTASPSVKQGSVNGTGTKIQNTSPSSRSTSDAQSTAVGVVSSPLPPTVNDHTSSDQLPIHRTNTHLLPNVASPVPAHHQPQAEIEGALPGLRGVFQRKPNAVPKERAVSIALQDSPESPTATAPSRPLADVLPVFEERTTASTTSGVTALLAPVPEPERLPTTRPAIDADTTPNGPLSYIASERAAYTEMSVDLETGNGQLTPPCKLPSESLVDEDIQDADIPDASHRMGTQEDPSRQETPWWMMGVIAVCAVSVAVVGLLLLGSSHRRGRNL